MISLDIFIRSSWSRRLSCEEVIRVLEYINNARRDRMLPIEIKTTKYVTTGVAHYIMPWNEKCND